MLQPVANAAAATSSVNQAFDFESKFNRPRDACMASSQRAADPYHAWVKRQDMAVSLYA